MTKFSVDDFAAAMRAKDQQITGLVRAGGVADLANSNGRIVRYLFSDPSVARDRHTIQSWKLDNFNRNPVFLWAHQSASPPIGRVVEIEDHNGTLRGAVEYADRDLYPFADTVFQLVRGGYINAVSTSWDPIKWKFSTDRSRPGGIDFEVADLLELSQVPVPALPTALATARSKGIDTGPIYEWATRVLDEGGMMLVPRDELEVLRREAKMPSAAVSQRAAADWKCGASRNLPIDSDASWDGAAAEKSIFDKAGFDGDSPDTSFARKGFLFYDAANPKLKGSYKEPIAMVKDGRLTAVAGGIRNAASRLPQTNDVPDSVKEEGRAVIDHYESKMSDNNSGGRTAEKKDEKRQAALAAFKRDLCQVAWLAYLLSDLDFLEDMVEWEAAIEEDGSTIPAQIAAVKKQLGEILIAMTNEEVAEMNDEEDAEDVSTEGRAKRALLAAMRQIDHSFVGGMVAAARNHIAGEPVVISVGKKKIELTRAGKVLSGANEKTLRDAHDMMTRGCDMVRSVFVQNESEADDSAGTSDDDADAASKREAMIAAKAVRERKARALKRKATISQ